MDEPSMGLAPFVIKEVFKIIRSIRQEGTNILLVEQNAKQALKVADKGYILEVGRIVVEDTAQNILASQNIQKSYLGG
jgi:branched-chain amino acid transport system ATP-binding protein